MNRAHPGGPPPKPLTETPILASILIWVAYTPIYLTALGISWIANLVSSGSLSLIYISSFLLMCLFVLFLAAVVGFALSPALIMSRAITESTPDYKPIAITGVFGVLLMTLLMFTGDALGGLFVAVVTYLLGVAFFTANPRESHVQSLRTRSILSGTCPGCGYPIQELEDTNGCPECGVDISLASSNANSIAARVCSSCSYPLTDLDHKTEHCPECGAKVYIFKPLVIKDD